MSKYDSAGLAMIPSGYKASKVYSLIPNSSDGDFDFARSSSATRVNKDGLIEVVQTNVPRLDYPLIDGVVQDTPSLLLEPSRRNDTPYSNDFNQHSIVGGSINSDDIVSPDGSINADTFVEDNNNSQHRIREDISVTSGTYTVSCFAKGSDRFISLYPQSAGIAYAIFDIVNGTITKTGGSDYVNSSIQDYGNGWFRCMLTYTVVTGTSFLHIYLSDKGTGIAAEAPTYTGNGSEISFYGLQLESGSYATSYIPTSGSTVTRVAETCNGAGTSVDFNDSEGVLFAEIKGYESGYSRVMTISDSSVNNRVTLFYPSLADTLYARVVSGGVSSPDIIVAIDESQFNRVAFKYKTNDLSLWINGFELGTETSATMPVGLSELAFDNGATTSFEGNTKQLITFKQALTDAELEDLTSWDSFSEMATAQGYSLS